MTRFFNKHRIISSFLVTAIHFIGVFLVISFVFHSDEYHAELSLSGDYFGEYAAQYPFINAFWSRFLIVFYRLLGMAPWYSVFNLLFLFVSFSAIHYSVLTVLLAKNIPLPFAEGIYSFVFCVVLLPNLSAISFTFVSVVLVMSAISLIFIQLVEKKNQKKRRVFSIILIVFAFCVRAQSCFVGLCFYFLTLIIVDQMTKDEQQKGFKGLIKGSLPTLLVLITVAISLSALAVTDNILRNTPDGQAVLKWNSARSKLFDYYDESLYEQDKPFFEGLGYTHDLFTLTKRGYFLDEKCDEEHLSKISDHISQTIPKKNMAQITSDLIKVISENISNRKIVPLLLPAFLLFCAAFFRAFDKKKNIRYLWIFYICSSVAGCVLMCIYLSYVGRFVLHVFRLCVFPATFCLFFAFISLLSSHSSAAEGSPDEKTQGVISGAMIASPIILLFVLRHGLQSNIVFGLCVAVFTGLLLLCSKNPLNLSVKAIWRTLTPAIVIFALSLSACLSVRIICFNTEEYSDDQSKLKTVNEFVSEHSDMLLISSFPGKTDIKNYVRDSKTLINCFYGFDYMQYSDVYRKKLDLNNVSSLSFNSLVEDNAYWIGGDTESRLLKLIEGHLSYLYKKEVKSEVVESLDNGVKVYRFTVTQQY